VQQAIDERTGGKEAALRHAHREVWFLGSSAAMFLCILVLGVYLLIRVSRDIHWFQLRSDFVSGVSHELKTPLSLIRLYSETLADEKQNYPPEERHNYIRIIARESERLTRLIDNILDFSKIEQGRRRHELQEADLAATVKQTVEDYSEYLFLRGFTVKTGIQPDLPPVRFNREQVSQMILNLMDNARKYSDKSRLIRVHMWRERNDVVVEIQDYGFGIPAEEQEKIFEPFYRMPKGSEKGGCGLGLYLVRNVIDGHGGRIEVVSQVGKGSRFRLILPSCAAA
jgi:signal transduction histidine kinase